MSKLIPVRIQASCEVERRTVEGARHFITCTNNFGGRVTREDLEYLSGLLKDERFFKQIALLLTERSGCASSMSLIPGEEYNPSEAEQQKFDAAFERIKAWDKSRK